MRWFIKEIPREVLRVFGRIAAPTDKYENGPPVNPAKLLERVMRFLLSVLRVTSRQDQAPPSGGERARLACALLVDLGVHEQTF